MSASELDRAAGLIGRAEALLVCAGAGMGVDSGLPDFRGDHGFWRAYPPYERLGLRFVEVADPEHFANDPRLAWGFYGHRLELYRRTEPHRGFDLLRDWGAAVPGGVRVFTSNVDGQFQRAGFRHVAEAHGSIHHLQCTLPCREEIWSADEITVQVDEDTMRAVGELPSCPHCGNVARPNILMFGDFGWIGERSDRGTRELADWRRAVQDTRLVIVELGAGGAVPTVRRYSELAASAGSLIRINPREPDIPSAAGVSLPLPALEALDEINSRL